PNGSRPGTTAADPDRTATSSRKRSRCHGPAAARRCQSVARRWPFLVLVWSRLVSFVSANRRDETAEVPAAELDAHDGTGLERRHARGCAGVDEVAGQERHHARDVRDDERQIEDHENER